MTLYGPASLQLATQHNSGKYLADTTGKCDLPLTHDPASVGTTTLWEPEPNLLSWSQLDSNGQRFLKASNIPDSAGLVFNQPDGSYHGLKIAPLDSQIEFSSNKEVDAFHDDTINGVITRLPALNQAVAQKDIYLINGNTFSTVRLVSHGSFLNYRTALYLMNHDNSGVQLGSSTFNRVDALKYLDAGVVGNVGALRIVGDVPMHVWGVTDDTYVPALSASDAATPTTGASFIKLTPAAELYLMNITGTAVTVHLPTFNDSGAQTSDKSITLQPYEPQLYRPNTVDRIEVLPDSGQVISYVKDTASDMGVARPPFLFQR